LACVWRSVLLSTFAVCVMPIIGCGGGGSDPVAKSQAIAFARVVNIRRADVPRMSVYVAAFETKNGPPYSDCTTNVEVQDRVAAVESPWLLRSKRQLPSPVRFTMPVPPVEGVHSVVYGPVEVVLVFAGVERPFPPTEERRLLSRLYARAKAQDTFLSN
jgi:hypothetical protein